MMMMTAREMSENFRFIEISVHFGKAGHCADEGRTRAVGLDGPLASVWVGCIRLDADTPVWINPEENKANVFLEVL